mmetsp:Transcript_63977/g.177846  ORF Transcript_63977/g.177846 Transcript_63977/m.177846 type:complete len:230 (-) Transcript_63977:210-899(-)
MSSWFAPSSWPCRALSVRRSTLAQSSSFKSPSVFSKVPVATHGPVPGCLMADTISLVYAVLRRSGCTSSITRTSLRSASTVFNQRSPRSNNSGHFPRRCKPFKLTTRMASRSGASCGGGGKLGLRTNPLEPRRKAPFTAASSASQASSSWRFASISRPSNSTVLAGVPAKKERLVATAGGGGGGEDTDVPPPRAVLAAAGVQPPRRPLPGVATGLCPFRGGVGGASPMK